MYDMTNTLGTAWRDRKKRENYITFLSAIIFVEKMNHLPDLIQKKDLIPHWLFLNVSLSHSDAFRNQRKHSYFEPDIHHDLVVD